jgi:hypothetical protein
MIYQGIFASSCGQKGTIPVFTDRKRQVSQSPVNVRLTALTPPLTQAQRAVPVGPRFSFLIAIDKVLNLPRQ